MIDTNKGFTLIELLVVISIIGLLSSVVLASLNSVRAKAKDALIRQEMQQLVRLAALNYQDYGSYCQLQTNQWVSQTATCSTIAFSGTYASQAQNICTTIYNSSNYQFNAFYSSGSSGLNCANQFSFMAALSNGNWLCVGSGGAGEYSTYTGPKGCWNNP